MLNELAALCGIQTTQIRSAKTMYFSFSSFLTMKSLIQLKHVSHSPLKVLLQPSNERHEEVVWGCSRVSFNTIQYAFCDCNVILIFQREPWRQQEAHTKHERWIFFLSKNSSNRNECFIVCLTPRWLSHTYLKGPNSWKHWQWENETVSSSILCLSPTSTPDGFQWYNTASLGLFTTVKAGSSSVCWWG